MSIKANFKWSQDIYVNAGKLSYKYNMSHTYKKYIGYFFLALTIFGIVSALKIKDYSLLYLGVILTIYWYYVRGIIYKKKLKDSYKKEGINGIKMNFEIDNNGLKINKNLIPWSHIEKVILSKEGVMFKRAEGYPFIPDSAFLNGANLDEFKDILDKNSIDIIVLK